MMTRWDLLHLCSIGWEDRALRTLLSLRISNISMFYVWLFGGGRSCVAGWNVLFMSWACIISLSGHCVLLWRGGGEHDFYLV